MAENLGLLLIYFIVELGFLVLCMHLVGRYFGFDFGPFWRAITKAGIILLVVTSIFIWFGAYLPWYASVLVFFGAYYFGFMLAFGLDASDAAIFTVIYFIAIIIVRFVVIFIILGARS